MCHVLQSLRLSCGRFEDVQDGPRGWRDLSDFSQFYSPISIIPEIPDLDSRDGSSGVAVVGPCADRRVSRHAPDLQREISRLTRRRSNANIIAGLRPKGWSCPRKADLCMWTSSPPYRTRISPRKSRNFAILSGHRESFTSVESTYGRRTRRQACHAATCRMLPEHSLGRLLSG